MSKKLFLDTNILLDFLGERDPFYIPSAQLATLADHKKVKLIASPISFATVNYFLTKSEGNANAKEKLRKFKILCEVAVMNESILEKALNSDFEDFEDALQYFCALDAKCDIIITRNPKDFKHSLLPIMSAEEYLKSV